MRKESLALAPVTLRLYPPQAQQVLPSLLPPPILLPVPVTVGPRAHTQARDESLSRREDSAQAQNTEAGQKPRWGPRKGSTPPAACRWTNGATRLCQGPMRQDRRRGGGRKERSHVSRGRGRRGQGGWGGPGGGASGTANGGRRRRRRRVG